MAADDFDFANKDERCFSAVLPVELAAAVELLPLPAVPRVPYLLIKYCVTEPVCWNENGYNLVKIQFQTFCFVYKKKTTNYRLHHKLKCRRRHIRFESRDANRSGSRSTFDFRQNQTS